MTMDIVAALLKAIFADTWWTELWFLLTVFILVVSSIFRSVSLNVF